MTNLKFNQKRLGKSIEVAGLASIICGCLGLTPLVNTPAAPLKFSRPAQKSWPRANRSGNLQRSRSSADDSDLGRPTSRRGGQGRNPHNCFAYPIALIPGNGEIEMQPHNCREQASGESDYSAAVAYTATAQPTLWAYIPAYDTPNLTAKITLIDNWREQGGWEIPLRPTAGMVCFTLPQTLAANNTYAWELEVLLTPNSSAANPKVSGFVTYTQQADEYWYDDLKTAIQQRQQVSTDTTLVTLLAPQGLETLATGRFPDACQ